MFNKKIYLFSFTIILLGVISGYVVNGEKLDNTCEYKNNIELSKDLKNKYEIKLKSIDNTIKSFSGAKNDLFLYFIDKSRYEQYLGNYCASIKTLNYTKKSYGNVSPIVFNNLGSVYDEVGDYSKAIKEYEFIIDNKLDIDLIPVQKKIINDYINLKDRKLSLQAYKDYEKKYKGKRDNSLINQIRAIKGLEPTPNK